MTALGLRDEKHFREHYQQGGVAAGLIEMTLPDKMVHSLAGKASCPPAFPFLRAC